MTQPNVPPGGSPIEARRATRDLVDFETKASNASGFFNTKIVNISPLGLMARYTGSVEKGDRIYFELPHIGTIGAEVRWVEDGRIGTEFSAPIAADDYATMKSFMPQRQTAW